MDVFQLRDRVVNDYANYASSFIEIRDSRISEKIRSEIASGTFWPEPLIQLNPSFKPGKSVDELVQDNMLHVQCANIFRVGKHRGENKKLTLHTHQLEAIQIARKGHNYVLTTGTGSGKSMAYIIPIVDHVLRNGSGNGIQAIVVYPMNALANSQEGELRKFLDHGFNSSPVTFAKYTGQESDEQRKEIIANPPDILLTNYVMLELILTRTKERQLIEQAKGLRFLVLDELHTYRGRQGADVALLVRRVKNRLDTDDKLQIVGTSATLASEGSSEDQRTINARVASHIFGAEVYPEHVINETLQRATPETDPQDSEYRKALVDSIQTLQSPPKSHAEFIRHPLAVWIEDAFGLEEEKGTGRLVRRVPRSIRGEDGAALELSQYTGLPVEDCEAAIQRWLMAGYEAEIDSDTEASPFAFRLHQFISPGDYAYASIEPEETRYITVFGQRYKPGSERQTILYPLVFCRECGQEFYSVRLLKGSEDQPIHRLEPRDFHDRESEDDNEAGYLYINSENPWPTDIEDILKRVPDDWLEIRKSGPVVKSNRRTNLPRPMTIDPAGEYQPSGTDGVFLPMPFLFCPCCGVSYTGRLGEFSKLATLNSEGRSSATTIISLSTVLALREAGDALPELARKLLSFTDNRQDASLQAGHFNDLVDIGMLRGALYRAVLEAGNQGLRHDDLTEVVFETLNLPLEAYALNPDVRFQLLEDTYKAFREVIGYRLYLDLRRGWRVTSPNLEQTGLLRIEYLSLDDLASAEDIWNECHPALSTASPDTRARILRVLLDALRRSLAIHVDFLKESYQERIKRRSSQRLDPQKRWAIDEDEAMIYAPIAFPRSRQAGDRENNVYLSSRSSFGQYLRRTTTFQTYSERLRMKDTDQIIPQLMEALKVAGLVYIAHEPRQDDELPGYQLQADAMIWRAGDGKEGYFDPLRTPQRPEGGVRVNEFFVRFYTHMARLLSGVEAREHTAQVQYELREEREAAFRAGKLPVLYCSPTMELGVDISELNVVNMRNVPPTPANYAQRSGRAGRSGQPAFVITYCSAGSPHDQYFFRRPEQMVAGAVAPPRIDLANEDLVRAHVYAVWLSETGINLGETLKDILDLDGNNPTLNLLENVVKDAESQSAHKRSFNRGNDILHEMYHELRDTSWYHDDWLSEVLSQVVDEFDRTCDRWRGLYRSTLAQIRRQNEIIQDASRHESEKRQATLLRRDAEARLRLLTETDRLSQSDFYSYRYFATEGFLPGYSFPRLPIIAQIPGRRGRDFDEFVSRPRFLAISEFGPRALLYHEGSRYLINQVMMPADEEGPLTTDMKQCDNCGYMHRINGDFNADVCDRCGAELPTAMHDLMRLQNVVTRRRDRISSDEEERLRMGYDIHTGVRFAETPDKRPAKQVASVEVDGEKIAHLEYGQSATLWRINLGWRRRKVKNQYGFVLDIERGYWARNEQSIIDDSDDPLSERTRRVIPYVEDSRNCLIFEPEEPLHISEMLSLEMALKRAVESLYQLEDNELAVEILPNHDQPRLLLFYEAAEGGAGVLRRLIDDRNALSRVAEEAIALCHYDPKTIVDLGRAEGAREDCEAACYECLLSYSNQRYHDLLDRHKAVRLLEVLQEAQVNTSPTAAPRQEHLERLWRLCDSKLEREWLEWLDEHDLRLPDDAQYLFEPCQARFDFLYRDHRVAVFVDGTHHDADHQQLKDQEIDDCLMAHGITPIRFRYDDNWEAIVEEHNYLFGGSE